MIACIASLALLLPLVAPNAVYQDADLPKGLAELQGAWKLTAVEVDGKPTDEPVDDFARWIVKGDKVLYGGAELAALSVDPATTPKSIDLHMRSPKRDLEGIYAVEGEVWKMCVNIISDGVKERPLDFKTEERDRFRVLVFRRDKSGAASGPEGAGFVGIAIRFDRDKKLLIVASALEGGAAKKAGLKDDDVLVKIAGQDPGELRAAVQLIRQTKAGKDITLRIRRAEQEMDITVRAGVLPFFVLEGQ